MESSTDGEIQIINPTDQTYPVEQVGELQLVAPVGAPFEDFSNPDATELPVQDLDRVDMSNEDLLLQNFIYYATHGPLVNPNATFNQSVMFRSPTKSGTTAHDIYIPTSHLILRPAAQPVISQNPYLATLPEGMRSPVQTRALDLDAKRLRILAGVDWPRVVESAKKNSGKRHATGYNKQFLVKILEDLDYKPTGPAWTRNKDAIFQRLMEVKLRYDEFLRNNPDYLAKLNAGTL